MTAQSTAFRSTMTGSPFATERVTSPASKPSERSRPRARAARGSHAAPAAKRRGAVAAGSEIGALPGLLLDGCCRAAGKAGHLAAGVILGELEPPARAAVRPWASTGVVGLPEAGLHRLAVAADARGWRGVGACLFGLGVGLYGLRAVSLLVVSVAVEVVAFCGRLATALAVILPGCLLGAGIGALVAGGQRAVRAFT